MSPDQFLVHWRRFVARWAQAEQVEAGSGGPLLDAVLEHGLAHEASRMPDRTVSESELRACEIAVIRRSGTVDVTTYAATDPPLKLRDGDMVRHFCERGWKSLRNPSHGFDVWWYVSEYLDGAVESVNPLLHFVLAGRFVGNAPGPEPLAAHVPVALDPSAGVRRVCLFAGSDVDGIMDPHVVRYLRQLSRFADVYYLSASLMTSAELDKLAGIVKGAWSARLNGGEISTCATLARDFVGWDLIAGYDELVLANDGHYLLRPLDDVFEAMDKRVCDWWTLRVTTPRFAGEGLDRLPIPFEEVRSRFLPQTSIRRDATVRFDRSFVAVRRAVHADEGFRRMLDRMVAHGSKAVPATRHEIGLTRYLTARGYDLSVFDDALRPADEPFGPTGFELAVSGYPLLSRVYLATNPDSIPDVWDWKRKLGDVAPAILDEIESHLVRVSSDADLQRSFAVVTRADGTVDRRRAINAQEFRETDAAVHKYDHWWAFPVCAYDHTFAGNERAVFEEVRDDPSIKKIILTRSRRIEMTGDNVVTVPIDSPEGQYYLLRSRFVFVKHSLRGNVPWPMSSTLHDAINLWHGIPLKRFGTASAGLDDDSRRNLMASHGASRATLASSRMDVLAMSAAFFPVPYPDIWVTGLPRNDFIVRDEAQLPADLRASVERLRDEVAGRRLVMFLPTFKDGQSDAYYPFGEEEIQRLAQWAERHNAVIGVREHMADKARTYSTLLAPLNPIDLSSRRYPDLEILYRVADVMISDYSSCLVDFLLTGRPVMSFAYDYERYDDVERGLFYDLGEVLPGPVCRTFDQLAGALDGVFDPRSPEQVEEYEWKRRIFFDHLDDQASWRVVQRVKELYLDGA